MKWIYHDGGRKDAGYKGSADDCVTRAIAIATGISYQQVYHNLNDVARWTRGKVGRQSNSRTGVFRKVYQRYLEALGWKWVPTMKIGQGCKVHLKVDELPPGKLIVRVSRHLCAVEDGVVYDTHDPGRGETRCVYGYFKKETT